MHNVIKDETRYIGIDQNLGLITALEVQPIDYSHKIDKSTISPTRQLQNVEGTINTQSSPMQKMASLQQFNSDNSAKDIGKMSMYSQQISNPSHINNNQTLSPQGVTNIQTNTSLQNIPLPHNSQSQQYHREMQTLIAYAEKAKETHLKEQKFNSKKVYGIQNIKNKKSSQINSKQTTSPTNNMLRQTNQQQFVGTSSLSPRRHSPTKTINLALTINSNNLPLHNLSDSPTLFNLEEVQNVKYLVKVNVFTLGNPEKKYVLQHFFDEYFYVQQISLKDKESLCYTLCANQAGEQLFFIWNFRKEIVIGHVEMKNKINKFVVTPNKSEMILFLGEKYLKYYEANFTNKIIKENSLNIIPMKIEKESNFIDMEYINPKQNGIIGNNLNQNQGLGVGDMFVLITDNTNSIFIFEKNQLKHKLFDCFRQSQLPSKQQVNLVQNGDELNKTHDSVLSDSLEIGELSDREDIGRGQDHLRIKSLGTHHNNNKNNANKDNINTTKGGNKNVGLDIHNFQQQMKAVTTPYKSYEGSVTNKQSLHDLKSPPANLKKENDNIDNEEIIKDPDLELQNIIFQKISVTQKGFIIGCSDGYIICYEFKNDYEPKMVNKVHISNKIEGVNSMSLSKGQIQNDDYYIAIAGVYQKELKKSLRKQNEGDNQIRSISQRNNQHRNNIDNFSPTSHQQDFLMPPFLQKYTSTLTRKSKRQSQEKISDQKRGLSQLNNNNNNINYGTSSNLRQDDQHITNVFGPSDIVEKQEFVIVNMKAIQTQQQNKIVEKVFAKGAHDGSIFQIASCRNKSSFYTISEQNNLKIWNHTNEWKGVSNYILDEQPLCIDVHPSSWQIALGFKSGVKIYQALGKEMKLGFEKLGKAALAIAYSDGGQMLACTNAVYIDIIDPIRMQVIVTLFGHKGLVRNLSWTLNSKFLISTCSNGGIFFWRGNFKEQTQKIHQIQSTQDDAQLNSNQTPLSQGSGILPLGVLNDKNYLYNQIAYDEELDVIIALTSTSTLRLMINYAQDPVYEEDLLTMCSLQQDNTLLNHTQFGIKATCMTFSKSLSILVIGFSNGKLSVLSWPLIPNLRTFKFDIMLQQSPITDVRFNYGSRYLMVCTDDGNMYVLDTFRTTQGLEKTWLHENQDKLQLQKKREQYGLTGFSITDNLIMSNKEVLKNVNKKIDKLKMLKKSQEVNHEIKKRKTEKRFAKQMKLIGKELHEELEKQGKLISATDQQFTQEKEQLQMILEDQTKEHEEERKVLIDGKEVNLNFVSNENDELETRILRLKETIVNELEKIEDEHQQAVNELVQTYEQSVRAAQDEVKNTIEKLKQNGQYYENMVKLQERDYEQEVSKLQADLIEDHAEFVKKKEKLENDDNFLKDDYQNLEGLYKDKNSSRKRKIGQVQELKNEYKAMFNNLERLQEKNVQSNIFIDEKEKTALETVNEKKQLENVIAFLSEKIKELKNERMPLEERKKELENMIQDTYKELQDDFQFRKYLELKLESLDKKMEMIQKDIQEKEDLKESIEQKNYIFKRELSYLAEAQSLKGGWTHKMQGMLKCMSEVYFASTAKEVKKISTAFIHIAEIMESNARPYRPSQHEDDQFTKQSKLNEMELAYYRNKNSQKMEEMQLRFKTLFSQMEKSVKKLRNDNIKLIEEFNTLINEKKKLNNLRKMIKESLKEFLGDKYSEDKHGSSDDDAYKTGGTKNKKKKQRLQSQESTFRGDPLQQQQFNNQNNNDIEVRSNQNTMNRSKSTSQFTIKHAKILQNVHSQTTNSNFYVGNQTERAQDNNILPDLKQASTLKMSQVSMGGSMTSRDNNSQQQQFDSQSTYIKKNAISGFSLNKSQQLMNKRRFINNLNSQQSSVMVNPQNSLNSNENYQNNYHGSRYLERIVDEFEKNKKQIEEQTKTLQKIQSLAQVFTESQITSPQQQQLESTLQQQTNAQLNNQNIQQNATVSKSNSQVRQQIGAAPAVPSLNLRKMMLKQNEQQNSGGTTMRIGGGSQTARQTITTRVPVSTDRTQSIISMFHQQTQGMISMQSSVSRQLPTVREKSSLYNTKESFAENQQKQQQQQQQQQ